MPLGNKDTDLDPEAVASVSGIPPFTPKETMEFCACEVAAARKRSKNECITVESQQDSHFPTAEEKFFAVGKTSIARLSLPVAGIAERKG